MARLPKRAISTMENMAAMMSQPAMTPHMVPVVPQKSDRILRRPYEDFFTVQKAWDIQPLALMPVLPGETLMNMQLQARVLTDSVRHQLSGWWMEYYVFYVKHTDLAADADERGVGDTTATAKAVVAMHLEGAALGLQDSTRRDAYYKANTDSRVDWVKLCTDTVVKWYFRDAEEPLAGYGSYGVSNRTNKGPIYKARVRDPMWLESLKIEDVSPASDSDLPGTETFNDVFVPSAFSTHYAQWESMRQLKMIAVDVTFEDYLATWGIKAPPQERQTIRRPELIRYLRN